jgi:Gas vesicle synthesis protein GvpL/GvpF
VTAASAKYVYGILPAGARTPSGTGVGRRRLKTVEHDGLAAIVSDLPSTELEAGGEDLMAHSAVLKRALKGGVVLPMRFGLVMPDAEAVREELLVPYRDELELQLRDLDGKVELHLRAVYVEERLMREVTESHPEIAGRSEALRNRSPEAAYYERIELGQLVAEAVERARSLDTAVILEQLEPLSVAVEVASPEHERVAARIYFLVEQERLGEFDHAVDELGARNEGRLQFKYNGPLPPYSFVALPSEA